MTKLQEKDEKLIHLEEKLVALDGKQVQKAKVTDILQPNITHASSNMTPCPHPGDKKLFNMQVWYHGTKLNR